MTSPLRLSKTPSNPLDSVEEFLVSNDWTFDRMTEEELMVEVTGRACTYDLFFIWQRDMKALQFCCQYDLKVLPENIALASKAIMKMNEALWMGHFDIPHATLVPSFRQTCLMRGVQSLSGVDQIEDLVDISLAQCERFFPVFDLLSKQLTDLDKNIDLALMDPSGRA